MLLITIKTNISNASFDIEVPDDVAVSIILKDLAACMEKIMHVSLDPGNMALSCDRLNIILDQNATLGEQGVWNGDYIQLTYFQE